MTDAPASSAWSWRHAITKSDLPATTRHVLLTLSLYMSETGQSCYPKVEDLAAATGLSMKSVMTHLQTAVDAGWLWKGNHGLRGQRWRRSEYEPRWPDRGGAAAEIVDPGEDGRSPDREGSNPEGGETGSPPSDADVVNEVHHLVGEAGEPRSGKVVKEVHQDKDQSSNHSSQEREGALARDRSDGLEGQQEAANSDGDATRRQEARSGGGAEATGKQKNDDGLSSSGRSVLDMIALYPSARQDQFGQVDAAWNALTPDERQRALDELPGWLDERKAAKLRRMFLQTYLGDKQFDLPKGVGGGPSGKGATVEGGHLTFANWSREWFGHLVWCATNGRSFRVMVDKASTDMRGRWGCRVGEMPAAQALSSFVRISSASPEWKAWEAWFRGRDKRAAFPSWDRAAWFDLPSKWPPGVSPETSGIDHHDYHHHAEA